MGSDSKTLQIVEAAERLFLLNGLRATTMEAIAREASVAKPTLYGRFPDKETLFRAAVIRRMEALKLVFSEELEKEGALADRVASALAAKYAAIDELLRGSPHAEEILTAKAALAGTENVAIYDWTREMLSAVLKAGGVKDAGHRAALILAAIDGISSHAARGDDLATDIRFAVQRLLG